MSEEGSGITTWQKVPIKAGAWIVHEMHGRAILIEFPEGEWYAVDPYTLSAWIVGPGQGWYPAPPEVAPVDPLVLVLLERALSLRTLVRGLIFMAGDDDTGGDK